MYYKNVWNHTCDPCHSGCYRCTTPSNASCVDCRLGKYFLANISGKYCLSSCPVLYYFQSGTNCLDCYSTCQTCNGTNSDTCTTCLDGLYLSAGMCRYVCPSRTYPDKVNGVCAICEANCTFCFGPTIDNCTACRTGLVLSNFTCTTDCPTGLTVNQWGVCFEGFGYFGRVFMIILVLALLANWWLMNLICDTNI